MNNLPGQIHKHHVLLVIAFFSLSIYFLFRHDLGLFWHSDDSVLLLHMLRFPLAGIFFDPASWQALSQVNLTPWISLSLFIDYSLAGMNPEFFYWHQLAALGLVALASYLLLALFVNRIWALAGSVLFLLGAPVASVAAQLMTRHYVEGLWLFLFSLYFFIRYQRGRNRGSLLASVIFFALAVTAKEIYVPLGLLFVLLARSGWRERAWQSLPYIGVLVFYVVWRKYMLPGMVDGYVVNTEYFTSGFWLQVLASFLALPRLILGVYVIPVLVLFGLLLVGTVRKMPEYWLLFVICTGLMYGPLIPLVYYPGLLVPDKYLLLPWFMFCFAAAFFTGKLLDGSASPSRIKFATALVLWGLVCIVVPRARTDYLESIANHFQIVDTQMRFLWNADRTVAFIPTAEVASALYMLPAMKELKLIDDPQALMPLPIVDDKFLTNQQTLFAYSTACTCMMDISSEIPARLQQYAASNQPDRPLMLEITNDAGLMSWNFGPYPAGAYAVVIEDMGSISLPKTRTKLRTLIKDEIDFYLRYSSPEGWITYSPLIHLEADGQAFIWGRE